MADVMLAIFYAYFLKKPLGMNNFLKKFVANRKCLLL